jgi:nucleoside-diphosphate-sugar epimerase
MKVLLFGGTRFMGRYVLRALLDVGVEVTIANRGTREENKGAQNIICDRSQPGALEQFKDSHFDAVIDFSAYASEWVEEAGKFFAGKISRYVFISTGAVYTSSQHFPITEDFPKGPPHPFAPYAAEKIRSETLLRDFNAEGAFDTTALRLPFVLGPDNYEDRESFVFSRLLSNEPILLANGGKSVHSFIYAGDVANAIVRILSLSRIGGSEEFNLAIPQATTSRGFVDLASEVCGFKPNVISYQPEEFQIDTLNFDLKNVAFPFPENNAFLSSEKILSKLGFAPSFDLNDMLSEYCEWWIKGVNKSPKEYPLESRIKAELRAR